MQYLQQGVFLIVLVITVYFITKRVKMIKKTIQLGKSEDRSDQAAKRLSTMIRIAFGQKKMFDRPLVGILHFIVYAGFIIINIEILEIIIDGILGTHRIFASGLGSFYDFLINSFETLAVGVILACIVFLIRRKTHNTKRLSPKSHREMKGWPEFDANLILGIEIVLMWAFLSMNTTDSLLQSRAVEPYTATGGFFFSSLLSPLFEGWSSSALIIYERAAWWLHILGIFAFAVYVTYSKHLHIALAFPNTYFASLKPKGKIENMPTVTQEVKIMLGMEQQPNTPADIARFGAKDVDDLSWKNLMDAYSCTECGRCTAACPASQTGKDLSPRKIMMDTRDRLEDIQNGWLKNGETYRDDKTLMGDYISEQELLACTSCNACVQECPILINPLDIILQLRRYNIMEESKAPQSWNMMFQNLETNGAPWQFAPTDRLNWAKDAK